MDTYKQLTDKIKSLGFKQYNDFGKLYFDATYKISSENICFKIESLNINYQLVDCGEHTVFICQNSGARSQKYTFQEAYERIEKEFKDKLLFKAFNSHLFKEVETPKEVNDLLNKNTVIFNLIVSIENLSKQMEKPIYYEGDIREKLYELHNMVFYSDLEDKRNFQAFESYKYFIRQLFGIKIRSNKTPEKLYPPSEGYTLRYLETVSAYQLLIYEGIIKEDIK